MIAGTRARKMLPADCLPPPPPWKKSGANLRPIARSLSAKAQDAESEEHSSTDAQCGEEYEVELSDNDELEEEEQAQEEEEEEQFDKEEEQPELSPEPEPVPVPTKRKSRRNWTGKSTLSAQTKWTPPSCLVKPKPSGKPMKLNEMEMKDVWVPALGRVLQRAEWPVPKKHGQKLATSTRPVKVDVPSAIGLLRPRSPAGRPPTRPRAKFGEAMAADAGLCAGKGTKRPLPPPPPPPRPRPKGRVVLPPRRPKQPSEAPSAEVIRTAVQEALTKFVSSSDS